MSRYYDMPLTMESDVFASFKEHFDDMLARTVGNMQMKGAEEATITVKFGISLAKEQTRDYRANGHDLMRDVIRPTIKHDITSVMQVKDKSSGKFAGNYELVWDKEEGRYIARKVDDGQISVFDDDIETVDDSVLRALPAAQDEDEDTLDELPYEDNDEPEDEDDGYSYDEPDTDDDE